MTYRATYMPNYPHPARVYVVGDPGDVGGLGTSSLRALGESGAEAPPSSGSSLPALPAPGFSFGQAVLFSVTASVITHYVIKWLEGRR